MLLNNEPTLQVRPNCGSTCSEALALVLAADLATLGLVSGAILGTACLAYLIPALRATRVDPPVVFRGVIEMALRVTSVSTAVFIFRQE